MSMRERLRSYGFSPRKSLGQNFLADDHIASSIVDAANIDSRSVVIEIGPGIGALTRHLVAAARIVIAVELDQNLIPILSRETGSPPNLVVIHGDALKVDFPDLVHSAVPGEASVTFVGNLPYYITSAVVRRMLECTLAVQSIVLTVQLEVAQRMTAKPDDMNLLAVGVQFYGRPEILMRIDPSAFYPSPEVDSALVRITPHVVPLSTDSETLFTLARAGFNQRRKQLHNTLSTGLHITRQSATDLLQRAGIDSTRRAETLGLQEWIHLSKVYCENRSPKRDNASASSASELAPKAENTTEL